MLRAYVLEYLGDPRKLKQNQTIVDNLKSCLFNHLSGQKTTPIVMAKNIVCTLASFSKSCSSRQVA
jgi:predicted transcriptional regulator